MQQAVAHHDISLMIDSEPPHTGRHNLTMRPRPRPGASYRVTVATQNHGVIPSYAASFEPVARVTRPVAAFPPIPTEAGGNHTEFSIQLTWHAGWQRDDEWSIIALIYDLLDPPTARWQPRVDRHAARLDVPGDIV